MSVVISRAYFFILDIDDFSLVFDVAVCEVDGVCECGIGEEDWREVPVE